MMSSRRFERPLVIEPAPSRHLRYHIIAWHAAALVPIACLAFITSTLALAGLVVVAASGCLQWRALVLGKAGGIVVRAVWQASGAWALTTARGAALHTWNNPRYFISLYAIVLWWPRWGRRACRLILFPDSLPPEIMRRLRVRLQAESPK